MGIRIRCPNGHRLNVKSFLAGKRGVCPYCKAKFQIPNESLDTELVSAATETATKPNSASETQPATVKKNAESADPPGPPDVDQQQQKASNDDNIQSDPAHPLIRDASVAETADPQPTAAELDPIREAPHAVWYVRPPSGGQYGPASGDIMRTWISEGRVSGDSLVWRQGWPEWKNAENVFPVLTENFTPGEEGGSGPLPSSPQIVAVSSARISTNRAKRSQNTIVILLGAACLVLFVVLIFVIKRNS